MFDVLKGNFKVVYVGNEEKENVPPYFVESNRRKVR